MTCYSHDVIGNGSLIIVRNKNELGGVDGNFVDPPKMYILNYNIEHHHVELDEVSFTIAKSLAPEKYEAIMKQLHEVRMNDPNRSDYVKKLQAEAA